jgi:predicted transcriptional regulator
MNSNFVRQIFSAEKNYFDNLKVQSEKIKLDVSERIKRFTDICSLVIGSLVINCYSISIEN